MLTVPPIAWIGFGLFFLVMLALDLGVFHRRSHVVTMREALAWTATWVSLALLFGAGLWTFAGHDRGIEFLTGYLLELSLSADNVFVIAMLFTYFAVPQAYQHKVLLWGVIGAVVMRFVMILAGTALVAKAAWVLYLFGGLLIVAGVKMIANKVEEVHPESNPLVKLFRRLMPVTKDFRGDRFFVKEGARWFATPLFITVLCVEAADLVFAIDSIPAIFSVTLDPFIVFTSNVFAILGLRSLYFLLAKAVHSFRWLKPALGVVLAFAGVKMLLAHTPWKVDNVAALVFVAATLAAGVIASLAGKPGSTQAPEEARGGVVAERPNCAPRA
ncbi:MAG: TerC family protein [Candidatus Eisenbacteria bacterium]